MNKPSLFIVGAAKCGTTALSDYLRDHPKIYFSVPKEPHYFAIDLENYRSCKTEADYLSLFSSDEALRKNPSVFGEASVFYIYSKFAIEQIRQFSREAKIVVIFRKPLDMVASLHSQLCYSRDESIEDFAAAWAAIPMRKQGKNVPVKCRERAVLYYDEVARFGDQYERLCGIFEKQQIRHFFFEDFVNDPRTVYENILEFVGVESDNRSSFENINLRRRHKNVALSYITQRPPRLVASVTARFKKLLGIERLGVMDAIRTMNLTRKPRPAVPAALRREINECYKADIEKLGRLTGRDLSHWTE